MNSTRCVGGALALALAMLGCGTPLPSGESEGESSTSAATSSESSASDGATSESTSDEGTSDEGTDDSTDTTGEPPSEPYYIAYSYFGGYDRVIISKIDPIAVRCTSIQLVLQANGAVPPEIAISTPPDWSVERISLEPNLDNCQGIMTLLAPGFDASAGVGTVTWVGGGIWPETIDIDVTLSFVQDEPWKPAEELLSATGIVLDG